MAYISYFKFLTETLLVIISTIWIYYILKHKHYTPLNQREHYPLLIGALLIWIGFITNLVNEFLPLLMELSQNAIIFSKIADDIFVFSGIATLTHYFYQRSKIEIKVQIKDGKNSPNLKPGGYIVSASKSFSIDYSKAVAITRNPEIYKNIGIPYIWISKVEGENAISPTNLPKLLHTMISLSKKHPGVTFIIDSVEYLALENGFESTFKFLISAKDHLMLNNSSLVLIIEDKAFKPNELALLKKEFKEIS
ncbi:regulatory protein [Pyrococcus furiosus COM1]|nr:DUF835 domain-containing protein [Pyrococcus furiosus]AFN04775.1 regulatory protein [Pyrococcus furiosus COM1]